MQHLHHVAAHSEINSMPPSNLGIVFGPTLLRTPEGSASLICLADTVHQTRAIELLITHTKHLFPSLPNITPSISSSVEITSATDSTSSHQSVVEMVLPGFIAENAASNQAVPVKELANTDCDFNSSQGIFYVYPLYKNY